MPRPRAKRTRESAIGRGVVTTGSAAAPAQSPRSSAYRAGTTATAVWLARSGESVRVTAVTASASARALASCASCRCAYTMKSVAW